MSCPGKLNTAQFLADFITFEQDRIYCVSGSLLDV